MEQNDFREILKKYLSGCASERENEIVENWYKQMGQKPVDMDKAEEERLEEQYLSGIMRHVVKNPRETKATARLPRYFLAMAASVLLLIVAWFAVTKNVPAQNGVVADHALREAKWTSIANNTDKAERHTLPDGTSVTLESNSTIKFSPDFNQSTREVQLEGEGFFEVVPNKEKPFLVYADEVTTRVLGTSFTVRSFPRDKQVTVVVKTGTVSVLAKGATSSNQAEEIILTPNQEVTYDRKERVAARRIVEKPQPIISTEEVERLRFEDAPLTDVLKAIEKVYGVHIEYDAAHFSSCTITTSVSGGGLYNRMDIITSAIGASYEVQEAKIVVKGSGCNYRKR